MKYNHTIIFLANSSPFLAIALASSALAETFIAFSPNKEITEKKYID